jgi:glycosyltransferase involved in cell wall biosynthesis
MYKVWLIQNVIAPYRVRLFEEIVKKANFDFSVVLTARKCRHRPHWDYDRQSLPFPVLTMKGVNIASSCDSSLSISLGLVPSLIRRRPDVVICGGLGLSTLFVFFYAKLFNKKYIVWSEATQVTKCWRNVGRFRSRLRKLLVSGADAFVDAGTCSREYIQSLLSEKFRVPFFRSYNCVDESAFSCCRLSTFTRGDMESRGYKKILFVGQLTERKGIPMLLETYKNIIEVSNVEVRLVIIGDGPLRSDIDRFERNTKSAKIELHGHVPYSDVAAYYECCDAFVLLSVSDCNPLVVFEALHAGIPIICSANAGNAYDFIVSGKNGYIVEPTDKDRIVQHTLDVLNWDFEKRHKAAMLSRRLVKKANYRDSAQAFIDACENLLPDKT